ncbi:hypothetical protein [Longitalea luteola]|uniref:hypothetical protein n=1 Tax=Longitalea luteola TaxID=2812563 RepID=UPI001A973327|nr:hypothetical protein [Longitalea luteola]
MATNNLSCDSITGITNAWYNELCNRLNLSTGYFQLFQPVIVPENNQELWAFIDLVPPKTLKFNYWYYHQPGFFGQYAAIADQLQLPESAFEKNIGQTTYAMWNSYLQSLPQPPPENTLPTVWFQWALLHAPAVANIGRSGLASEILLKSGRKALTPYQGPHAKSPDYSPAFPELFTILQVSPPIEFSFTCANGNPDVSNSWVTANDPNLFGMWTGSWCGFLINKKFAQSNISVSARFEQAAVVTITPGAWYDSGVLHLALASTSVPPWNSITAWDTWFGQDGVLNYAMGSVLAVDGLSLTLTSDAAFTSQEQAVLQSQASMGFWPMYCPSKPAVIKNRVSFDAGKMTITCQAAPGNPILIGGNVVRIGQYLGGN